MTSSAEGAAGGQHTRSLTPLKLEEVLTPAQCLQPFMRMMRHHGHIPSEKQKWQYACRLLGMSSLKEGAT
jgi:hypothetical protein